MSTQNAENKPAVRKETKNKIRVEFERTSLKERLKAKFLNLFFLKKVTWWIVRFILLVGIAYIVLFPFFTKIAGSFMTPADFKRGDVKLIPTEFTLNTYKEIFLRQRYLEAFGNTFLLSFSTAIIQTFICSFIAYGFAKFKFKGSKILFVLVIFTMVVPHRTLSYAMSQLFSKFDFLGIFGFLRGGGIDLFNTNAPELTIQTGGNAIMNFDGLTKKEATEMGRIFTTSGVNLLNTYWPFMILSVTGLAFKNGLYIFLLRQFFMGVPDELEESAYIDGSGVFRTFFTIILPLSVPMMITVFLFAFSWCWTDNFYTSSIMFFNNSDKAPYLLTNGIGNQIPTTLQDDASIDVLYEGAIKNTGGLMIIAPLVIMYLFCQKFLVQGIERSGLTAD